MLRREPKSQIDSKKVNEVVNLSKQVLRILKYLLIMVVAYLTILLLKETGVFSIFITILRVIAPLFIGFTVAWLFNPLISWMQTKHIRRSIGTIIVYVGLCLILYAIMASFIPILSEQISDFAKVIPDVFESLKAWASNILDSLYNIKNLDVDSIKTEFIAKANEIGLSLSKDLPNTLFSIISGIFSVLGVIVVGLIIGFFFLVSFENTTNLFGFIPKKYRQSVMELSDEVNGSLRKYVQGAVIDCTIVFILCSLGFWLVGLQAPLLFGLFCGLTNIIPYLGPYIGGAPAVIVGLTQDPLIAILILVIVIVVQFLEGNILQPFIMAKTTKLHPVTIMLGLLVFGHFFGILGMLLSTPILAAFKTIFMFYNRKYVIIEPDEAYIEKIEKKEE